MELPSSLSAAGDQLLHLASTVSTMDEARSYAPTLAGQRLWIVADSQSGGRGRHGRNWQSPAGNLYMTLLMPAPCRIQDQPKLGFVAGTALCKSVRGLVNNREHVQLKWPNDLLVKGAKVSGLLLEGLQQGNAVSIGIGVNIAAFPDDTPYAATGLSEHTSSITPAGLFSSLALALVEELAVFSDGSGFSMTRQRWLAMAAHIGKRIAVETGQQTVEGIFRDIDETGRLVLETAQGLMRIDAGDVFPLDK